MKYYLSTDKIIKLTMMSLGGTSEYISNSERWLNSKIEDLIFSTYSMRMPIDSPITICKADNKLYSRQILKKHKLPIINWKLSNQFHNKSNNSRYAIKPLTGMKGLWVIADINYQEVKNILGKISPNALFFVEPYIDSNIYRVLVLNHKVIGIYERFAPFIIGDGKSNVNKLIQNFKDSYFDKKNQGLPLDFDIEYCLKSQKITPNQVLDKNQKVKLTNVINISRGASWKNIPLSFLSEETKKDLEESTKVLNLKLAGVDLIQKNDKNYILEVNPSPGLLGHILNDSSSESIEYNFTIPQKILSATINYLAPDIKIQSPNFTRLSYDECLDKLKVFNKF